MAAAEEKKEETELESEQDAESKTCSLHDFLSKSLSSEAEMEEARSLLCTEMKQYKKGYVEFFCDADDEQSYLHSFEKMVKRSLSMVQNGLYVLLWRLPRKLETYKSAQDVATILSKLYQIMDDASRQTHGLLFDSRIFLIHSAQMYDALSKQHLPLAQVAKLDIAATAEQHEASSLSSCAAWNRVTEAVFGGTFDHLHSGHKVLITMAALLCSHTLFIGLSVDKLLERKKYSEMLQSFEERKENLLHFIQCIKPSLKVVVEPLHDLYGPSLYESVELLIVSQETLNGGLAVNQKRAELGRQALQLIAIDCITNSDGQHTKISSTDIRCFEQKYRFLYQQWQSLVRELAKAMDAKSEVPGTFVDEWWSLLFALYQQQHRYYHTLRHIEHLLRVFVKYSHCIANSEEMTSSILLAIWFHDVVYDATSNANERLSMRVFQVFVLHFERVFGAVFNKQVSERVLRLIEATIKHELKEVENENEDDAMRWFLDFDLAILAQPQAVYEEYAANIRKEYSHILSPQFEQRRCEVLKRFLARSKLYFTHEFQQNYEDVARQNIAIEIQKLQLAL